MTRDARVFRRVFRHCALVRLGDPTTIDPDEIWIRPWSAKAWARQRAAKGGEFGRLARAWLDGKAQAGR